MFNAPGLALCDTVSSPFWVNVNLKVVMDKEVNMQRLMLRILLVGLAAFFLYACGYNTMQQNEEAVFSAWGNVESNLQRRADLIPNLVETVKGYAAHERETLEGVIEARKRALSVSVSSKDLSNPDAMVWLQSAQGDLSSALSRLMVVVERYPDLKASQNFLDLQSQLEGTENRIAVARQRYNLAVQAFNASIRKFPNNLTNRFLLNLDRKTYFNADGETTAVPAVTFQ